MNCLKTDCQSTGILSGISYYLALSTSFLILSAMTITLLKSVSGNTTANCNTHNFIKELNLSEGRLNFFNLPLSDYMHDFNSIFFLAVWKLPNRNLSLVFCLIK